MPLKKGKSKAVISQNIRPGAKEKMSRKPKRLSILETLALMQRARPLFQFETVTIQNQADLEKYSADEHFGKRLRLGDSIQVRRPLEFVPLAGDGWF